MVNNCKRKQRQRKRDKTKINSCRQHIRAWQMINFTVDKSATEVTFSGTIVCKGKRLRGDQPLMYKCITYWQRPSNTWIFVHVMSQVSPGWQEWPRKKGLGEWENFHTSWEHIPQAWRIKDTQLKFCTNTSLKFILLGEKGPSKAEKRAHRRKYCLL